MGPLSAKHLLAGALAFGLVSAGSFVALREEPPSADVVPAATPDIAIDVLTAEQVLAGIDMPMWRTGFAWDTLYEDILGTGAFECTTVVVEDTGEGYTQGFACDPEFLSWQLAMASLPFVGNVTYGLNGHEEGRETRFFSWPLTDGAEWTMDLEGNEYEVIARFDTVEGPFGPEPGYVMSAEFEGGSDTVIEWTYVPSIAWWGHIEFVNLERRVSVTGFTPDHDGVAYTVETRPGITVVTSNGPIAPSNQFSALDEDDIVRFTGRFDGFYSYQVSLVTPAGRTTFQARSLLATGQGDAFAFVTQAEAGTWTVQTAGVVLPGSSELVATLGRAVAWPV